MERRRFFQLLAVGVVGAALEAVGVQAEQSQDGEAQSPKSRACDAQLGADDVENVQNGTFGHTPNGTFFNQEASGVSSADFKRDGTTTLQVQFNPGTDDDSQTAIGSFNLPDGRIVTDTIQENMANFTSLNSPGFVEGFRIETTEGVTASVRICDTTHRVYAPIIANQ